MAKKKDDIVYLVEDSGQPVLVEAPKEKTPAEEDHKNIQEVARKKIEAAEKRALEAERRAQEAERKLKENEARRKTEVAEFRHETQALQERQTSPNTTRSVQELADIFGKIANSTKGQTTKWKKMAEAVASFPTPNIKADLFEFSVSMHSKMGERLGGEGESERAAGALLMTAYLNKYKECVSKIKALYPTDPSFANLLTKYSIDLQNAKKAIWWQRDHTTLWVITGMVAFMLVDGIVLLLNHYFGFLE